MCIGIPMRVITIDGSDIVAEIDGVRREASTMILDQDVKAGDFVIVHAGFAIAKLDEKEALETLRLMREVFLSEEMT